MSSTITTIPHTGSREEPFMRRALELASRGVGHVHPNPLVGAVIVRDGRILAEGWHARHGDAHAEIAALRALDGRAPGATLYVTLEPCCHLGKTPPCTEAIIAAGIARVVFATTDPNPLVRGGGAEALRAAGILVESGLLEPDALRLNVPFFHFHRHGRPFISVKAAATLDGKVADSEGRSRWISSEASRRFAHELRARADAIVVGRGTAATDDPALTVRHVAGRNPVRVLLDSRGRLPDSLAAFRDGAARTIRVTLPGAPRGAGERWEIAGDASDRPSVRGLARRAADEGWRHLLVEGGPILIASFLREDLVDEVHLVLAPRVLGSSEAPAWSGELGSLTLDAAKSFRFEDMRHLGPDLHARLVPERGEA